MKRLFCLLLCLILTCQAAVCLAEIIPPAAYNQGFYDFSGLYAQDAVVLCDSLSVRPQPDFGAEATAILHSGDPFVTDKSQDGWLHVFASDGSVEGWVRGDYVLVCPSYLALEASTPAYAYGDEAAPRVALLDAGVRLPIILTEGAWTVVSLRGASAWIHTGADGAFTPERCAHLTAAALTVRLADGQVHTARLQEAAALEQLSALLTDTEYRGVMFAGCPFGAATLALTCADGAQFALELATDSCCVYRVEGRDYAYARDRRGPDGGAPDNGVLFSLFSEAVQPF